MYSKFGINCNCFLFFQSVICIYCGKHDSCHCCMSEFNWWDKPYILIIFWILIKGGSTCHSWLGFISLKPCIFLWVLWILNKRKLLSFLCYDYCFHLNVSFFSFFEEKIEWFQIYDYKYIDFQPLQTTNLTTYLNQSKLRGLLLQLSKVNTSIPSQRK